MKVVTIYVYIDSERAFLSYSDFTMLIDFDQVQLLFLFLSVSEAIEPKLYSANFESDNKASMYTPSDTLSAASLSMCASMCGNRCQCFSFNSQTKMCRLHSSCNPDNVTVSDTEWRSYTIPAIQPKDCKDLYKRGKVDSGVYTIYPWGRFDPNYRPVQAYCDMKTEGGGWTAIQRRVNGEENFNRSWTEYKVGFENPQRDYWIGNDAIHQLTKGRNSSLYISITSTNKTISNTVYGQFSVSREEQKYKLHIADYENGSLDDAMLCSYYNGHAGMNFSTFDMDNDGVFYTNYASDNSGGWWFSKCCDAYLNGPWFSDDVSNFGRRSIGQ